MVGCGRVVGGELWSVRHSYCAAYYLLTSRGNRCMVRANRPRRTHMTMTPTAPIGVLEAEGWGPVVDIEIAVLPLSELFVDKRFQRELNEVRVEKMVGGYDPKMFGVAVVNRRSPDRYSVVDGQHRLRMLQMLDKTHMVCQIVGIPERDEARLFVDIQHAREDVHPVARHKALLFARDPEALAMERLLKREQFHFAWHRTEPAGISTVRNTYALMFGPQLRAFPPAQAIKGSPDGLRFALRTIRESYGLEGNPRSRGTAFIQALAQIHEWGVTSHPSWDEDRLYDKLATKRGGIRALFERAKERTNKERGGLRVLVANQILDDFSEGLPRSEKINPLKLSGKDARTKGRRRDQ